MEPAAEAHRVVLDTNVVVRGFINPTSSPGQILQTCERRRIVLLLSRDLLREYREVLRHPSMLQRYPRLDRPEVEVSLERLLYVSDFNRQVKTRFSFPRDPKDAPIIQLAIAGRATHIITADDDLLALQGDTDDTSKRFRQRLPRAKVMTPNAYVRTYSVMFEVS